MIELSAAELIARLRWERAAGGACIVATDADGTLWSGDVGDDAWNALLAERRILPGVRDALREQAISAGVEERGEATDIARALMRACFEGRVREDRMYEIMAWAFAGQTMREARAFAREIQRRTGLASRIHREMAEIVRWTREENVPVWVVSASPLPVVIEAVALLGIDAAHVIAAEPALEDGVIATRLAFPLPFGQGKARALARSCPGVRVLAAFGDNDFDVDLLSLASLPVAVRPKAKLVDRATEVHGLVRLAAA